MRRRFTAEERRARLAVRHNLVPRARVSTATEAARNMVGLHATDPATVFLAAWARMKKPTVASIERELYDDRSIVRVLGMRRTLFVVPPELAAIVLATCRRSVASSQRRMIEQFIERAGIAKDAAAWLKKVEKAALEAVAARGAATAAQVSTDVPLLRKQILLSEGKNYESRPNVATFVLRMLALDGKVMHGRPRGSWLSTQYEWSTTVSWLPDGLSTWTVESAQAELVRRWLAAYGPATVDDVRWWTGLALGEVRRALAEVRPVEVDLDLVGGIALAGDLETTPRPQPWAALLPGLDPTVMGWADRTFFLGGHKTALFDTNGNAGPTVWWDGRVVGGWAQRKGGEIVVRLLEDVGADAVNAIDAEAARLRSWLGPARVLPRFGTPLVRELTATSAGSHATTPPPQARSAPRRKPARRPG